MKTRISIWLTGCLIGIGSLANAAERPNILWITSEDNGPELGAYGDDFADTPNIDGLASKGMIYLNAWSTAPVCAPARTAIISGVYPTSLGAQHMRSSLPLPRQMAMYPEILREAGYYCTNNRKEDYNLKKPGQVWDESSGQAHWKNREDDQPFFAIFNYTVSHESQIRRRPHELKHDPQKVRVPDYHPDTPEVRRDWAQYYDKLTEMDERVGQSLRELEEAGLTEETIVFYYGDHGSGMPRSKRWPFDSGLHVPLIVYIPEQYRHLAPDDYTAGGETDRLVGFVDLAPTLLSLVGIEPPPYMQGHAFMGEYEAAPRRFLHGFRGRMDERIDMVRSVRDKRYIYIRNYMPYRIYGQFVSYMFQTPTTRVWKQHYDQGKLNPAQSSFWESKPAEELYDLQADPDEVHNLADSLDHQDALNRLRRAQQELALAIRDVGFLPEHQIHSRSQGSNPYEMARDPEQYPMQRIMQTAELASELEPEALPRLKEALNDEDSAVRYWGASGIQMRGQIAVQSARPALRRALEDQAPSVRVVAAEALAQYGTADDLEPALQTLVDAANLKQTSVYVAVQALNAIDKLDEKAAGRLDAIKALPKDDPSLHGRVDGYVPRLLDKILADLEG